MKLTTHLHLVPSLRVHEAIAPVPLYEFMAWCLVKGRNKFTSPLTTLSKHLNNSELQHRISIYIALSVVCILTNVIVFIVVGIFEHPAFTRFFSVLCTRHINELVIVIPSSCYVFKVIERISIKFCIGTLHQKLSRDFNFVLYR
jgi:hypothetical protein